MFELLVLKKEQGNANSFSQDSEINWMVEFKYNPEEEVTFAVYFHCYEKVFQIDCAILSNKKKIRLLLGKLG